MAPPPPRAVTVVRQSHPEREPIILDAAVGILLQEVLDETRSLRAEVAEVSSAQQEDHGTLIRIEGKIDTLDRAMTIKARETDSDIRELKRSHADDTQTKLKALADDKAAAVTKLAEKDAAIAEARRYWTRQGIQIAASLATGGALFKILQMLFGSH